MDVNRRSEGYTTNWQLGVGCLRIHIDNEPPNTSE